MAQDDRDEMQFLLADTFVDMNDIAITLDRLGLRDKMIITCVREIAFLIEASTNVGRIFIRLRPRDSVEHLSTLLGSREPLFSASDNVFNFCNRQSTSQER